MSREFTVHPAAGLFPVMSDEEYQGLKEDIRLHGQREAVVVWKGMLVDGRHRLRACEELGIEPDIGELMSEADPVAYGLSQNLHRRHLSTAQRSMIAARLATLNRGDNQHLTEDRGIPLTSQADAAAKLKVSVDSVKQAKIIQQTATPEVIAAVEAGEISLNQAVNRTKPHVWYNSGENEWYTPAEYCEAARAVMGSVDLDPASCKAANKNVKAKRIYTADNDGLAREWRGNVWLNPPYGNRTIGKFIEQLIGEWQAGRVAQAIVLTNNATDAEWFQRMLREATAVCFPQGRIRFRDRNGNPGSPLQGQAFCYFGDRVESFREVFGRYGVCR